MRILLALAVFIALAAPALAQGNKIVVIGEDGSVSELDLGAPAAKPAPAPAQPPVQLRKNPAAPAPAIKAAPKSAPAPALAPAPVEKEAVAKPSKKPAAPASKNKKEKAVQPKSKKKSKQALPQKAAQHPAVTAPPSRPQRLGPNMTPDDAIRIAIDVGPPARSVNAYPVNYKGIHAYQVIFATEDGDRSIFIDRETGRPVK